MENKIQCCEFLGTIIIGYKQVNKIVVIQKDKKRFTRKLGICGLNVLSSGDLSYYDTSMLLHILDTSMIKEIKCYKDNNYINNLNYEWKRV